MKVYYLRTQIKSWDALIYWERENIEDIMC